MTIIASICLGALMGFADNLPFGIFGGGDGSFLKGGIAGFFGSILLIFAFMVWEATVGEALRHRAQRFKPMPPPCRDKSCISKSDYKFESLPEPLWKRLRDCPSCCYRCKCGHLHAEMHGRWVYITDDYVIYPNLIHKPYRWIPDDTEDFSIRFSSFHELRKKRKRLVLETADLYSGPFFMLLVIGVSIGLFCPIIFLLLAEMPREQLRGIIYSFLIIGNSSLVAAYYLHRRHRLKCWPVLRQEVAKLRDDMKEIKSFFAQYT